VRLLLDTNVLLLGALGVLSEEADRLINDPNNEIHYSSAAIWEIVIKVKSGKLELNMSTRDFENELLLQEYRPLNITPDHAHQTLFLDDVLQHKDPFDRIMVAQSIYEGMTFLTTDKALASYGRTVKVVSKGGRPSQPGHQSPREET
jgi:PIN domain nuclease of toxin-antitoxin system